jgi:hypothetical protein
LCTAAHLRRHRIACHGPSPHHVARYRSPGFPFLRAAAATTLLASCVVDAVAALPCVARHHPLPWLDVTTAGHRSRVGTEPPAHHDMIISLNVRLGRAAGTKLSC